MASQYPSPSTLFNGSTNWSQAQTYVKQMFSYLNEAYGCCGGGRSPISCDVTFMYFAMTIDAPDELNNSARWQSDIESLYRIMYPYTN